MVIVHYQLKARLISCFNLFFSLVVQNKVIAETVYVFSIFIPLSWPWPSLIVPPQEASIQLLNLPNYTQNLSVMSYSSSIFGFLTLFCYRSLWRQTSTRSALGFSSLSGFFVIVPFAPYNIVHNYTTLFPLFHRGRVFTPTIGHWMVSVVSKLQINSLLKLLFKIYFSHKYHN